jgi:hypothetical protein
MEPTTVLRVSELRAALDVVLARVEKSVGDEIDVDADYYWDIIGAQAFDPYSAPKPAMGQLTDDIERLRELTAGGANTDVSVWHDLLHLVGILRWIGNRDLRSPSTSTGIEEPECGLCSEPLSGAQAAIVVSDGEDPRYLPFPEDWRGGTVRLVHPRCFVEQEGLEQFRDALSRHDQRQRLEIRGLLRRIAEGTGPRRKR